MIERSRIVLIIGPSGAGRTTAIHKLEDLGFETIDNVPLSLIPTLVESIPSGRAMALSIGAGTRDFSAHRVMELIDQFSASEELDLEVLYMDASYDVLIRRFSETRRRHPLAPEDHPARGIEREFDLMTSIRDRADHLIDTSEMTIHEAGAEIEHRFVTGSSARLALTVHSFSYKRGLPRGMDMVFDCRFLSNPFFQAELRDMDGRDQGVADYIHRDERLAPFVQKVFELSEMLLPAYQSEGKAHLSIAFGCTGGQHRSVLVAELLAKRLRDIGWKPSIWHRELMRVERLSAPVKSKRDGRDVE